MRTAAKHISLSDARSLARRYPYALGTHLHALTTPPELSAGHQHECGCSSPEPSPGLAGGGRTVLALFDFDEETVADDRLQKLRRRASLVLTERGKRMPLDAAPYTGDDPRGRSCSAAATSRC
jgi:hypothetical protein